MNRTPISIIIDDPTPLVHLYREHRPDGVVLPSGEELLPCIPNAFLERFCGVVERFGISGKFSIVPMPAGRGDIVHGLQGFSMADVKRWLDIAKQRLSPYFDFCPEILTHHKALDLETGAFFEENEQEWAAHQSREQIARYIARGLELLRDAGIIPTGVTSPWNFGIEVEDAYAAAISDAFYAVFGRKKSWYFLHGNAKDANIRPIVKYREEDRRVVTMLRTVNDVFWDAIECSRTDDAYIRSLADRLIAEDGQSGEIIDALARNSYPILLTHWQCLFSNGRQTGLAALTEVARRIEAHLSDRVVWRNFSYLMDEALANEPS